MFLFEKIFWYNIEENWFNLWLKLCHGFCSTMHVQHLRHLKALMHAFQVILEIFLVSILSLSKNDMFIKIII